MSGVVSIFLLCKTLNNKLMCKFIEMFQKVTKKKEIAEAKLKTQIEVLLPPEYKDPVKKAWDSCKGISNYIWNSEDFNERSNSLTIYILLLYSYFSGQLQRSL